MKRILAVAALALLTPRLVLAASSSAYVPELTGAYTVGGLDPTWRTVDVAPLSWTGSGMPRYLNLELSGVLRDPKVLNPATWAGEPWLNDINFNGVVLAYWHPAQPRFEESGLGWGTSLNSNTDWEIGEGLFSKSYEPETGRFYFRASIDVAAQCQEYVAYMGGTCPISDVGVTSAGIYASVRFLNAKSSFVEITMGDPGFVFIESARVSLTDMRMDPAMPPMEKLVEYSSVVPEPGSAALWPLGLLALASLGARRASQRARGTPQAA